MILLCALTILGIRTLYLIAEVYFEQDWPRSTWRGFAVAFGLFIMCASAFGQVVRVDIPLLTSGPSIPNPTSSYPQTLWVPNATVQICQHPATTSSCSYVPTYTDITGTTPCPGTQQLVALPGTTCSSNAGILGNIGFWYSGGTVDYFILSAGGIYGPYTVTGVNGSGNFISSVTTGPQSMAGPLNVPALNNVYKADQFTGTTASEKITACLAAAGAGICDARGLTGAQTMDSTVEIGASGVRQTLLFDHANSVQPTTAALTMFKVDKNGQLLDAHIVIPGGLSFTGKVVDVEDTITNQSIDGFSLDGLWIDAGTYSAGGYGLYMAPPTGGWIQLTNFHNLKVQGLAHGIYITTSGSGTYFNGNNFSDIMLEGNGSLWTFTGTSSGAGASIDGNTCANCQLDGSNAAITLAGTTPIQNNIFSPVKIWDTTTPITNTNSLALGNIFIGSFDFAPTDSLSTNSSYPFQNIYMISVGGSTTINALNTNYLNFTSTVPAWSTAHNSGTIGWNSQAAGETDYYQNVFTGGYAHAFYAANSGNTGWNLLGGWNAAGDWKLGANTILPHTLTGFHGNSIEVQLSDGAGVSGNMTKFDASGNVTDSGILAATVPTVGTAVANQAVCFVSAGPPAVIGHCTSVVSAGGACTCVP